MAAGAGIGMLHLLAARLDPRIVLVLGDEVEARRTYWLVIHADYQRVPKVRAVINFLDDLVRRMRDQL